MKAWWSVGDITPLIISHNMTEERGEENIQTWVRGIRIDILISANNESFPLGSQGELGRNTGEDRKGWKGKIERGRRFLPHSHTHSLMHTRLSYVTKKKKK